MRYAMTTEADLDIPMTQWTRTDPFSNPYSMMSNV